MPGQWVPYVVAWVGVNMLTVCAGKAYRAHIKVNKLGGIFNIFNRWCILICNLLQLVKDSRILININWLFLASFPRSRTVLNSKAV